MEEVEAVQRETRVVDASVHMHAALLARVSLDCRVRVHDLQLIFICSYAEIGAWSDRNLREQRASRFPALRAAANVVKGSLALNRDGHLLVGTLARQRTTSEVCSRWFEALIDAWMNGSCHCQFPPLSR